MFTWVWHTEYMFYTLNLVQAQDVHPNVYTQVAGVVKWLLIALKCTMNCNWIVFVSAFVFEVYLQCVHGLRLVTTPLRIFAVTWNSLNCSATGGYLWVPNFKQAANFFQKLNLLFLWDCALTACKVMWTWSIWKSWGKMLSLPHALPTANNYCTIWVGGLWQKYLSWYLTSLAPSWYMCEIFCLKLLLYLSILWLKLVYGKSFCLKLIYSSNFCWHYVWSFAPGWYM